MTARRTDAFKRILSCFLVIGAWTLCGAVLARWAGAAIGAVIGALAAEGSARYWKGNQVLAYLLSPLTSPAGPPRREIMPGLTALSGFAAIFTAPFTGEAVGTVKRGLSGQVGAASRLSILGDLLRPSEPGNERITEEIRYAGDIALRNAERLDPGKLLKAAAAIRGSWDLPAGIALRLHADAVRPGSGKADPALSALHGWLNSLGCGDEAFWQALYGIPGFDGKDWELLGLKPGASEAAIKAAFRRRSKVTHPDSGEDGDADGFLALRQAYERLIPRTPPPASPGPRGS